MEDDVFEDETDEEEQERRHNVLIILFLFVRDETRSRIDQLTSALADGKVTTKEWADLFREELKGRHAEAWSIGRRLAGDMAPHTEEDQKAGDKYWARQEEFFQNFIDDLESGRYTVKTTDDRSEGEPGELNERAVGARARSFGRAIRGTLHWGFVETLKEDLGVWVLGDKDHCKPDPKFPFNCPDLAKEPPKRAADFETVPGAGDTPCLVNCDCTIASLNGLYSTRGIS